MVSISVPQALEPTLKVLAQREVYLYGVLLALVNANLAAQDRHQKGNLGFWGRARASQRNRAIDKFVRKLIDHKSRQGSNDPPSEIVSDLTRIEADQNDWGDIGSRTVDFLVKLVKG